MTKNFLLLNILILVFLVYLIIRNRSRPKPSALDFDLKKKVNSNRNPGFKERPLNCFFDFEGKSWDAFEVLDIPAGSPEPEIRKGFQQAYRRASTDTERRRIEAAFKALEKLS